MRAVRSKRRLLTVLVTTFSVILVSALAFQNCSEFKVADGITDVASLSKAQIDVDSSSVALTNAADYTLKFQVLGVSASKLRSVICQLDQSEPVDCKSGSVTFASLADGDHTINVEVETLSHLKTSIVQVVRKDSTAPTVQVGTMPAAITNKQTANMSFTSVDSLSGADRSECSLDGAAFATCVAPVALTALAQGSHEFRVRAYDKAGNVSAINTIKWMVDLVIPTVAFTQTPTALNNSTSAMFAFASPSGPTVSSFECQLDAGNYTACSSPMSVSALAAGSHTFRVRGTSAAGNVSVPVATTWTIDLVVPTIAFSQTPTVLNNLTSATFAFAGSNVVSYECLLDGGSYAACTSPKMLTGLAAGTHTFKARGTSAAGNVSLPISYTWTVDLTVPTLMFSQKPSSVTNATTAVFSFSGSGIATYECSIEGGNFAACTSPKSIANLAAGPHTFAARGTSAAGNVSLPISYSWMIDLTAPTVSLTQMPAAVTNQTTATFGFTSTTAISFECQLDTANFAACASPQALSGLTAGVHTYRVRGTSAAGNVSSVMSYSWTIDLNPPVLTLNQKPPSLGNSTSAMFVFSGTNVQTFECSLDSAAFSNCSSPLTYSGLSGASHNFQVRGTSATGNVSAPLSYTWTIDLVLPTVSITAKPSALTNSTSASFSFTGSANSTSFECSLDSVAFANCASPVAYSGLSSGSHSFQVRSLSAAGNVSTPAMYTWTVDLTPPTVTLTQTPPALGTSTSARFAFTGANAARFECKVDSASFASCVSPLDLSGLSNGAHSFQIHGISAAGNVSSDTSFAWTVDTVAPTAPVLITSVSGGISATSSITVTFTSSDSSGISRFDCAMNSGSYATCVSPLVLNGLSEGTNRIDVKALDAAGNFSQASSFSWVVDTVPPTAPSVSNSVGMYTSTRNSTISFLSTDAGTGVLSYQCLMDGAAQVPCTSAQSYSGLGDGPHSFSVTALDRAGNQSTAGVSNWTVDTVVPSVALTATPLASTDATTATFTFTATDSQSGLSLTACQIDGQAETACSGSVSYNGLSVGAHTFRLRAVDQAGNSNSASFAWTIIPSAIKQIVAGESHTCVITATDTVQCWGGNTKSQLGNNKVTWSKVPMDVVGVVGAKSITAGSNHTCVTTNSGSVMCWGDSGLFEGTNSFRLSTNPLVQISLTLSNVKQISAGSAHTCVVTSADKVKCWGAGASGQLGGGASPATSAQPVDVVGLTGVKQVSAGSLHTCAITSTDAIQCWGSGLGLYQGGGQYGASNVPVVVVGATAAKQLVTSRLGIIYGSTQATDCYLTTAGDVRCWANDSTDTNRKDYGSSAGQANFTITTVAAVTGAAQINGGNGHFCAITASETVKCWGSNGSGQLGNNSTTNSTTPVDVVSITGAKQLASGDLSNCVLNSANKVKCWGSNLKGQLGMNAPVDMPYPVATQGLANVTQLSSSNEYTCALSSGGTVKCFGNNRYGLLGNGGTAPSYSPVDVVGVTSAVQIGTGQFYACALIAGGTVKCWGTNSPTAVDVAGLSGVKQISVGDFSVCVVTATDTVKCWGDNTSGNLGNGTTVRSQTPVDVIGLAGIKQVRVGNSHACAITASDTVKCWGANTSGTLGNGTHTNSSVPVDVSGLSGVTQIALGSSLHSCALTSAGAVKCWGYAYGGALGANVVQDTPVPVDVASVSGVKQIAIGSSRTCIVTANDSVQCWGDGYFAGQLGDGSYYVQTITPVYATGLANIQKINAGSMMTCALSAGGTASCWGANVYGELGNAPTKYVATPVDVL